jgi:hypothetical protein
MEEIKLHQNIVRKHSRFKTFMKWFKRIFLFLSVCLVGAGIFVKVNPTVAADITDNYIRPIIGDQTVVFIENIFFNISDAADHLLYRFKKPTAHQYPLIILLVRFRARGFGAILNRRIFPTLKS